MSDVGDPVLIARRREHYIKGVDVLIQIKRRRMYPATIKTIAGGEYVIQHEKGLCWIANHYCDKIEEVFPTEERRKLIGKLSDGVSN